MSDIEERPSKIRKLDASEGLQDTPQQPPTGPHNDKNGEEQVGEIPVYEKNDLSKIDVPITEDPPPSKSKLKKLRRREAWEAAKDLRKDKRRDKRHEKQARKAKQRAELQDKIAKEEIEAPVISPEELAKKRQRPTQLPISLIIDCDFDQLMTEKELISLGAQLTRCYSDNRHSKYRAHMIMSSWEGALRTRFETVLTNHHLGWKGVRFMQKDFVGAAEEMDGFMKGPDGGKLVGALAPIHETKATPESKVNVKGPDEKLESETLPVEEGQETLANEPKEKDVVGSLDQTFEEPREVSAPSQASHDFDLMDLSVTALKPVSSSLPTAAAQEVEPPAAPSETSSEPSITYLTSDSPYTLDRLSPNTSYIIGGIVDKNRHKGLCYQRACKRGIPTAKLPIGEYMTMQSRSVLAVNHVVEIMLKWLETGDWGEAFLSVIPKRKEAKLRVKNGSGKEGGGTGGSEDGDDGGVGIEDEDGNGTGLSAERSKTEEADGIE